MEYLKRKEEFCFELCLFTSTESLEDYLKEQKLEVLLLSEGAFEENPSIKRVENVILLSENSGIGEQKDYPVIYKYQSGKGIFRDIFLCLEGIPCNAAHKVINPGSVEFIGVISPKGGSGKTTFSMALGEACGKSEKVLYISFEELGSCLGLKEERNGLSDLIYYLKQKRKGLFMIIQSLSIPIGGVDCIPSVSHYGDLAVVEKEDIDFLMEELIKTKVYKKVIFDIGSLNELTFHILERCNSVYVTHLERNPFLNKEKAFQHIFSYEDKESLYERMVELDLPKDSRILQGNYNMDNLLAGELGSYINTLLNKNAG